MTKKELEQQLANHEEMRATRLKFGWAKEQKNKANRIRFKGANVSISIKGLSDEDAIACREFIADSVKDVFDINK